MSNFQDVCDNPVELWGEYIDRVYQGSVRKFYKDFERDNIPATSMAYRRFYNPNQHLVYLVSDLVRELKRKQ